MSTNARTLRSTNAATSSASVPSTYPSPLSFTTAPSRTSNNTIQFLAPGSKLPGLTSAELTLLRKKQTSLASTASSTISSLPPSPHLPTALAATLIFAQHEAGTAVCVDPAGWLLTCSHCIGDTEDEYLANKRKWLLFYTGLAVQAECHAWDHQRDLALSKIIAVECTSGTKTTLTPENSQTPMFSSIPLPTREPVENTPIICIGQPGSDDLESTSPRKTGYNVIELSRGKYRGMAPGADPQDNAEIGALMHDAWTYWGHSGAPLVAEGDGGLVGVHSSWGEGTGMRRGVGGAAVRAFLRECGVGLGVGEGLGFGV